jgi:hypothetical protein
MIGTADAEHAIWDSCCHALLMLIIDVQTIVAVQTIIAVQAAVVTAVAHPLLMYVSQLLLLLPCCDRLLQSRNKVCVPADVADNDDDHTLSATKCEQC